MRAGEFPDGSRTLRTKIDMAHREPQHARPGDVPHPARHASAHGRQVVHLPHVRLGPRPGRLDRGDHAFDLHAGVREPPPALRLVPRRPGHPPPAADRVRPAEPDLHGDEQAAAPAAGEGGLRHAAGTTRGCPRISRLPPPRLHARGDPRVLRADRRGQVQQHGGNRPVGALPARGLEQAGRPGDGRAAAAARW